MKWIWQLFTYSTVLFKCFVYVSILTYRDDSEESVDCTHSNGGNDWLSDTGFSEDLCRVINYLENVQKMQLFNI